MFKSLLNIKKRFPLFLVATLVSLLAPIENHAQGLKKINTVVIDAGHGGKDSGATGNKSKEKDITLKIALKTGDYITKNCPGVKVIYTRDKDVFVSLGERARVANNNDADLFISIHCNSIKNSSKTAGVETFIMGEHRNSANLEVAKKENAAILLEDNTDESYGGFDPNSTEAYIAFSFLQSEHKQESLKFAEMVQDQMTSRVGRQDRGVQQAGFLVLYRTAMPSILFEAGFLSNPTEEKFLMSDEGQTYIASALYRAFRDYKANFDKDNAITETITNEQETNETQSNDNSGIVYKVQFDSRSRKMENYKKHYNKLQDVDVYQHNGVYKYTAGCFKVKSEADEYAETVKKMGYSGAFVVAFDNGKRLE